MMINVHVQCTGIPLSSELKIYMFSIFQVGILIRSILTGTLCNLNFDFFLRQLYFLLITDSGNSCNRKKYYLTRLTILQ